MGGNDSFGRGSAGPETKAPRRKRAQHRACCRRGVSIKRLRACVVKEHAADPAHLDDYLYLIDTVERHPGLARHIATTKAAARVRP